MTTVMAMTLVKAALTMVLWCQISLHNILSSSSCCSSSTTRLKLTHKKINKYSILVVITMTLAVSITSSNATRPSTIMISTIQRQLFRTILKILLQHLTQVCHTRMSSPIKKATKCNMRSTHQSNLIRIQNFQQKKAIKTSSSLMFHHNLHQVRVQDPDLILEMIETPPAGKGTQSLNTPQLYIALTKCVSRRLRLMLMIANLKYQPGPTTALILRGRLTRIPLWTGFELLLRDRKVIEEGQCHRRHQGNFLLRNSSDMFLRNSKGAYLLSSNDMLLLKSRDTCLPLQGVLVPTLTPRRWNTEDRVMKSS
mmetsp:Transcript_26152/g.42512  ORF Transcript_26152/g.42512 Transcript_26152/m.42512 type:complete len:310 (-) Transcript_26152:99-1028(-)